MTAHDYPDVHDESGYVPLFDGRSLDGWRVIPRIYGALYPGGPDTSVFFEQHGLTPPENPELHPPHWTVEDGALVGRQGTPTYGGYLITEQPLGDFDLAVELRPDWPADTGIMLRRKLDDWSGFQVLVDHRPSGGIGGFFGNGLALFSALPFAIDAIVNEKGHPVGLRADDPATSTELVTPEKISRLDYAAHVDDLLAVWRWDDWNELRIRCVGGALPVLTTWINGVKIAELNTANIDFPDYDPASIAEYLGPSGHIALEVHDNDDMFGEARWGKGAACRWRNVRAREY
ncbi:MAG: DUF1080 domain-containing protein [Beutenbergiaceae bacterium]